MSLRPRNPLAEQAVTLMVTCLVIAAGTVVCGFMIAAFADDPVLPTVICVGTILALTGLYVIFRDRGESRILDKNLLWLMKKPEEDPLKNFQPRFRRSKYQTQDDGENRPPSAESIRKIKDDANVWMPTKRTGGNQPSPDENGD